MEWRDPKSRPVLRDRGRHPPSQRIIHYLLERHIQEPRPLLERVRDIVVQRKRRSHEDIMMPIKYDVKVRSLPILSLPIQSRKFFARSVAQKF